MSVTNPWLTPYQRSYQQIKAKLIDDLKSIKGPSGETLITDYSEGNLLIMIISLFSAIAEVIHYYIDNMSRETFFGTARRFDSLVKHGELVDYHAHGAVAPTVDVVISRPLTSDKISAQLLISKGMEFTDTSGNKWLVTKDTTWYSNTTEVKVPCIQHEYFNDTNIEGTIIKNFFTGSQPRRIKVPPMGNGKQYENGTMVLKIADTPWTLVDTFAFSGKYDTHFRVEVDSSNNVYIVFGDGQHGMIPDPGYKITMCSYYLTTGANANVAAGSITNMPSSITTAVNDATCSNTYPAGGGSNYEDFDMLKEHIPLHVRTLGVAITKQDFIDLAMQVPGVNKVAADYECGRKLTLYITPDNGTVASSTLCETVYNTLSQKAPLTTWMNVKSAGITNIKLNITVTGNKSFSSETITEQIVQALKDKYSITNSQIGGQVRISDIYALIDGLPSVDYLHINMFYLKPWPTTIYGNSMLQIDQFIVDYAYGSMTYFLTFLSDTTYQIRSRSGGLIKEGTIGSSITIVDTINQIKFSLSLIPNDYKQGYRYSFLVSEPNKDYVEPGFNLPVFTDSNQLTLTVNEVL